MDFGSNFNNKFYQPPLGTISPYPQWSIPIAPDTAAVESDVYALESNISALAPALRRLCHHWLPEGEIGVRVMIFPTRTAGTD